jgi:hypothetical protein
MEKYKARLVAKGFTQWHGIDFTETYSPIIWHESIQCILAIAAAQGMTLKQFDIATTFFNRDLIEEIYMVQPLGFIDPGKSTHVCRFLKSLYGLWQSAQQWNLKFDS